MTGNIPWIAEAPKSATSKSAKIHWITSCRCIRSTPDTACKPTACVLVFCTICRSYRRPIQQTNQNNHGLERRNTSHSQHKPPGAHDATSFQTHTTINATHGPPIVTTIMRWRVDMWVIYFLRAVSANPTTAACTAQQYERRLWPIFCDHAECAMRASWIYQDRKQRAPGSAHFSLHNRLAWPETGTEKITRQPHR